MKRVDSQRHDGEKQDPFKDLTKPVNPKNIIIMPKVDGLEEFDKVCCQENSLFLEQTRISRNKIPRHVVSLDEKYLRRCLELIRISASPKAASSSISVNFLNSPKRSFSSKCLDSDMSRIVFKIPFEAATGSPMFSSRILHHKNLTRFLDSPRLHKLGALDFDSSDTEASIFHTGMRSPGGLNDYSPVRHPKEELIYLGKSIPRSGNLHKRFVSVSTTNSTNSSSYHSSSTRAFSQGSIRCMWKNGAPCFVFSSDYQKDEYLAELSPVESADDEEMRVRYSYLFHSRKTGNNELRLVGKMNVSTSFSVSPTNSKIMERKFVLFTHGGDAQVPCLNTRKYKGIQRKVVGVFKNSLLSRQRRISRFSKTNYAAELCSREPYKETPDNDIESLRGISLLDEDLPPHLESAAIVVKEDLVQNQEEEEMGGWGLKFLKKKTLSQTQDSLGASRSIDVILPAGRHGGPMTRINGPSSLIERWKSDGDCDCGGWDLGCPLTILTAQFRKLESSNKTCAEFSTTGSRNGELPQLRIASVQEGLHLVEFQTTLSSLQSFSIAVAYIHSQSSKLRPKISD